MNPKIKFPLFALGISSVFISGCEQKEPVQQTPNIIFILADDLGYSQIGCNGTDYYKTPNIDRLASEGMRFSNAYAACSVCSPTRASIMTGKYPARLHLTNFIPGGPTESEHLIRQPEWQKFLPLEEISIAEMLKSKGYKTAIFGKWHLSIEKTPPESLPYNPDKQGFDEHFVTYKPSRGLAQSWQSPENDGHNVDTITSLALNFLERNKSNPFLLIVSHNTIHNPLMERAATISKYEKLKESEEPENNPVTAAMIERLDNSCGRIFNKVNELGIDDNTVIIFFSDNGGESKEAAQTPLREGKGWLYEGGIREPFILKWKGTVKPGTVSHSVVSSVDFFPTFTEIAGITDVMLQNIDGKSILPILKDPDAEVHDNIFWHFPHYHNGPPSAAIRSGKWKLIEWYEKSLLGEEEQAFELFNLEEDPGETNNLAGSRPKKTEQLAEELEEWRKEVDAQMPVPNENYNN